MRKPGVNFDQLGTPTPEKFIQINPATGNRQLKASANDVMDAVERLGNIEGAALKLGVEEIEIQHWIDDHYIPTRYARRVDELLGWGDIESLQQPSIGTDWSES